MVQLRSLFHSSSQLEKVVRSSSLAGLTLGSIKWAEEESDLSLV